jgi:hypothetical protein
VSNTGYHPKPHHRILKLDALFKRKLPHAMSSLSGSSLIGTISLLSGPAPFENVPEEKGELYRLGE